MQISILVARALVQELTRRRLPTEAMCRRAGIDPGRLSDAAAWIDGKVFVALLDAALDASEDPCLGLHVGARTPTSALTVVGPLVASCATLRGAASTIATFSPLLVTSATFELRDEDGTAAQTFAIDTPSTSLRAFAADFALAMTFGVIRSYVGNARLSGVTLAHGAPPDPSAYETYFGCPVTFDAAENAVLYPAELLDRRQLHTDPWMHEVLERRAEALLERLRDEPERVVARVRSYLLCHERPGNVRVEQIARSLGVTERTLRRRLVASGAGYRAVLDAALRDIALAGLRERGAEVKEVAYRLGFSDVSTFHRAFKRWTGVTPAEYRDGARQRA